MGGEPKLVAFTFHDVVDSDPDDSGFSGPGPARYKLGNAAFEGHLHVFAEAFRGAPPARVTDLPRSGDGWMLTFDDGGSSSLEIGELLAGRNWPAHFLITTDRIGEPGFLDEAGIRELDAMGHLVGSHSCSHPSRMTICSAEQLRHEWEGSVEALSRILEADITVGSVPGGSYDRRVAEAADAAGIRSLFTSEPRVTPWTVGSCRVLGRFAVHNRTPTIRVRALARGDAVTRAYELGTWKLRRAARAVGGDTYLRARSLVLSRR
jgi:hypothetical protein